MSGRTFWVHLALTKYGQANKHTARLIWGLGLDLKLRIEGFGFMVHMNVKVKPQPIELSVPATAPYVSLWDINNYRVQVPQ